MLERDDVEPRPSTTGTALFKSANQFAYRNITVAVSVGPIDSVSVSSYGTPLLSGHQFTMKPMVDLQA